MDSYIGTHAAIIVEIDALCKPIYRFATTTVGQVTSNTGHGAAAAGGVTAATDNGTGKQIGHCVYTS